MGTLRLHGNRKHPPRSPISLWDASIELIPSFPFGTLGRGFGSGSAIQQIKDRFAKKICVWVCTNGDLIDTTKLHHLRKAGGDEIRFNLSALNYDLGPVELACRMIQPVAVEIPAIPEDYESVRKLLLVMQKIGVRHLNLHQLHAIALMSFRTNVRNLKISPYARNDKKLNHWPCGA